MSESMDNFKVHVIARSDDALERAVQLAMLDYQAAAWRGDGDTLILLGLRRTAVTHCRAT
jgi:hypothetical protein